MKRLLIICSLILLLPCCRDKNEIDKDQEIYKAVANYIADMEMPLKDYLNVTQHTILIMNSLLLMEELKSHEKWLFKYPKIEEEDKDLFQQIKNKGAVINNSTMIKPFVLDTGFHHFNYMINSSSTSLSKLSFSQVLYDSSLSNALIVIKHLLEDPKSVMKGSYRAYFLTYMDGKWWVKNKRRKTNRWSKYHCAACALKK